MVAIATAVVNIIIINNSSNSIYSGEQAIGYLSLELRTEVRTGGKLLQLSAYRWIFKTLGLDEIAYGEKREERREDGQELRNGALEYLDVKNKRQKQELKRSCQETGRKPEGCGIMEGKCRKKRQKLTISNDTKSKVRVKKKKRTDLTIRFCKG